ncbi:class A beta-lactamase-related serine hydrolase, partial [archaeon]
MQRVCLGLKVFFFWQILFILAHAHKWSRSSSDSNAPQEWNFNSGSEQVWYGDDMIYENYLGKKNIEYDSNFTRSTKFRICSNSKLMTTIAILQLVEDGKIGSIYDSIGDYLDSNDLQSWGYPANTSTFCPTVYNTTTCQNVTFVSLMSMSSGVIAAITCDYAPDQWQYQYCIPPEKQTVYPGSIADTISYFIQNPLNWPPGPAYNTTYNTYWYANENFIILSYFVEKYSNLSLANYFNRNIFQPLGMNDTLYDPWNQAFYLHSEQSSEYYFYTDYAGNQNNLSTTPFAYGSCASNEVNPGFQAGSGGVVSTLPDMAKWYASLFIVKNTSFLSDESLTQVLFPWALESTEPYQYYGLGIETMYADPIYSLPP